MPNENEVEYAFTIETLSWVDNIEEEALNELIEIVDIRGQSWLICDEECANSRARDQILDSVWATEPKFLRKHIKVELRDMAWKMFCEFLIDTCEDSNELVRALLVDENKFVNKVIESDGRGAALSPYDGEEVELNMGQGKILYAYRQN